jgi:hypothetical protein
MAATTAELVYPLTRPPVEGKAGGISTPHEEKIPMYDYSRPKSTPHQLIQDVICELEKLFGPLTQSACLKLLQADEVLLRSEQALHLNPRREWPQEIEAAGRKNLAICRKGKCEGK